MPFRRHFEQCQKELAVEVIGEDGATIISAADDVDADSGNEDARHSRINVQTPISAAHKRNRAEFLKNQR
jgi:hypothetical protein